MDSMPSPLFTPIATSIPPLKVGSIFKASAHEYGNSDTTIMHPYFGLLRHFGLSRNFCTFAGEKITGTIIMETQISKRTYYIGVNDRTTHRFEGLWPIPAGVSYNSYLVVGEEKAAIIDGVEASHAIDQINAIRRILGDRQPDYLVINHMEPDHSGSIAILRNAFPALTIVGNAQTLAMVKGFYGEESNTLAVKDGESLSLGSDTDLTFYLTPMVHWPETMMTFQPQDEILFSGDAFGCYGALNGAVTDSDMNTGPYFPEMIRYYANIVGKYGRFVQKALSHLADVKFSTVCPTHGPVWSTQLGRVISLYDSLSRYEPLDEGATVIYGSMYGNTARMAEAAAEGLASAGIKDISMHDASVSHLSYMLADIFRHRNLILAAPTYSGSIFPPMAAVVEAIANREIAHRRIALIGSHTWASHSIKSMTGSLAGTDNEFIDQPLSIKQSPDSEALTACRNLGRALATYNSPAL